MDPPPPAPKPKKERTFLLASSAASAQPTPPGTVQQQQPPPQQTTVILKSTAPKPSESKEQESKVQESKEQETTVPQVPKKTGTRKQRTFMLARSATAEAKEAEPEKTHKEKLEAFYSGRKMDYSSYTYSPEGNLVIKRKGVEAETIPLRRFRPHTREELLALDEERLKGNKEKGLKGIIDIENEVDQKLAGLRTAYEQYKTGRGSAKSVVLANKEVMNAQKVMNNLIHPEKAILHVGELQYKDIRIDKPNDDRSLGYDVNIYITRPFKREDLFGRYMTPEEEEALKTQLQQGGTAQDVYILDSPEDPDLGMLHPFYVKDFSYAATQYSSPLQAFEVERLRDLKNDVLVQQLMKTRSVRTIQNLAQQEKTPAPNAYELWTGILKAYYTQHKEFADKLKQTGDALFTLRDTSIPHAQEFLRALLTTRAALREGDVAPETDVIERVISEEEQKRAKVGAIIRNKMFHRG